MKEQEKDPTIVISAGKSQKAIREEIDSEALQQEALIAKAKEEADRISQMPKPPKELNPKHSVKLQDRFIDTQRKAIDSLLELLKEKDTFLKEWGAWVTSIRECNESVREAEKLLRNVDNKRVAEIEKALSASTLEVGNLKEQVTQLKQRVRLLLGE